MLKAGAERLSPGNIRFNHELTELSQDDEGVDAVVRDNDTGESYTVRSTYLLGADGALLVRPDRFVAWRSLSGSESPEDELADALGRILAKPVGSVVVEA